MPDSTVTFRPTDYPALLDFATGCALYLVRDYGDSDAVYLPLTYRRIRVFGSCRAKSSATFVCSSQVAPKAK